MSNADLKKRTLEKYRIKKEKEKKKKTLLEKIERDEEIIEVDENIAEHVEDKKVEKKEKKKKQQEENEGESQDTNEDTDTEHESDDSLMGDDEDEKDEFLTSRPPYFYIDYDEGNIQIARDADYGALLVKRNEGLTPKLIEKITDGKIFDIKKNYLILSCWKVLTKSNLNSFSYDCTQDSYKKFQRKMEETIKWGSKPYLKERLIKDERYAFTPFRDGVIDMLRSLYFSGVKIFIVCNSDYSFVKRLFEYYKIDKYILEFFTPSRCGLPNGRMTHFVDSYKDRRKINKDRVFICIERFVGRFPIKQSN